MQGRCRKEPGQELEQGQRRKELEHHKKELGLGQVQEQGHRKKMQELEHRRKLELG